MTPSSVTLTATPSPATFGQAVTLNATVPFSATGTVTFYDGTTVLGAGTISGTQATLTTVMLASGSRLLRAYYGGDATYGASSSTPLPQTVVAGTSLGFRRAVSYTTNSQVLSIVVGDFNGDGKQDFAAASGATAVSVFIGNGDGTFQAGVNYVPGSSGQAVAVGDFNGDGRLDLAVVKRFFSTVSVLLGNGDGTFQPAVDYPAGSGNNGVAVGDFDGDGKADLVVASNNVNNVSVLSGNGDGTFKAAVTYSVGATQVSVAVGDFNGDGKTDIAVLTSFGVSVLLGNGNGTFAAAVNYAAGSYNFAVAVGDFNGDGKADLAIGSYYSGAYVLLGNGDGTFGTPVNYVANTTYGVVVADLDGDGKADLVASNYYASVVGVLPGNGDGTFKAAVNYASAQSPYAVAVGDFNGDGKADLVAGSNTSGFSIMLGGAVPDLAIAVTRGGGFTQGQVGAAYTITVSNAGDTSSSGAVGVVITLPSGFTATSLGGNGWTCVLASLACVRSDSLSAGASNTIIARVNVANGLTGNVTSTFNVSGGGDQNAANNAAIDTAFVRFFTAASLFSSPNPAVLGHAVTLTATVTTGATGTVTFLDGTSVLGAATLAGGQAVFTTYLLPSGARSLRAEYVGDSTYGPGISATRTQTVTAVAANGLLPSSSYKVGGGSNWVGVGDFNGDGKSDLVTANSSSTGSISVLLGNGDGTFRPAVDYSIASYPNGAVLGDFNGDGRTDVALASGNGLYLLLGNGDGTFQTALLVGSSNDYRSLGSADFNGDGQQDLVALSNGRAVLFLGNGDGTFQPPVTVTASGTFFSSMAVADMNVDGKADLVCFNTNYASGATVQLGNGDGTFQSAVNGPATSTYPMAFATGDFNGDGRPDVAIIYWVGVAIQLGNGDGTLQASIQSTLSFVPGYFALAGDFNGDGKLDIAYTGYYSNFVYLAFGNGDGTFPSASFGSGTSISTDAYFNTVAQGDFNGDGKPDFAVSNTGINTVNVFLGGQFSGLNILAAHAGNFTAGQTGVYQISIQNPAFASTGTVTVTDTLPAGLTATAISGSGWTCTLSTLTCTRSDGLNSSASYPGIAIPVNVAGSLSPSTINNRASVSSGGIINTATDATLIVLATTTALAVSPNPSTLGQAVTMTATVTAGAAGTVLFSDGGAPLGAATLASGQASFSSRLLPSGQRSLVATYAGDATHAPSTSAVKAQTINASAASGFATGASYATGAGPQAIAVGDFNRDGKTDLVTANATANTVSVLLGNGDGTFGAKSDYAAGTRPVAVVAGDFNNDGNTDIAVANQTGNTVSILRGNGDGTFQAAVNYATVNGPVSLAVGDLNGDGKADLMVANGSDGTVTLLLGNGDGTFRAASTIFAYASWVVISDFNHDGKPDIAYASGAWVYVLLGNGDGTFQPAFGAYANSVAALAVADLNADGNADIVAVDGSNGVNVLLGKGDGTFQSYVHYVGGNQPISVVCADVNGDGKIDAVTVIPATNTIGVLLGNGDGTLQPSISYAVGSSPHGAVAGDFNGDGRTDLAVANTQSPSVSVLLGVLTPIFSVASSHAGIFALGQTGAVYMITVTNAGPGVTSGTVTVTDTLPAGLTATAIAGTGWSCTLATLICTRPDSLAAGASYAAVTVTMNVTLNTAASVFNQVSVSGGGAVSAIAADLTLIGLPSLSITKTHTGSFMRAQNGATYTVTVGNVASAAATSGLVTVTETVPSGLTLVSMAGTGWTCLAGGTTCTRNDALIGGTNYPALTVTVNVGAAATSPQVNAVSVSGGGSATANAIDSTTITPVTADSVSPQSGNTANATLTAVYSHTAGFANLAHEYLLINTAVNGSNACYVVYQGSNNTLLLANDSGNAFLGPIVAGTSATLQNSQCVLNGTGSSGVGSGNSLTLTVSLSFKAAFAGTKTVFLNADGGGVGAGWQSRGTWTVPGAAAAVVTADSVSPSSGNTASATLTAVYSHTAGFANLAHEYLLINTAVNGSNACYVVYQGSNNTLMLLNDAGNAWLGPIAAGTNGTLQNSQCVLNGIGSSGVGSGSSLTLTVALSFKAAFAGSRTVFLNADAGALSAGWQSRGTWTVPGAAAVTADSVSPSSGNTASATLTAVYSHTAGFANLGHEYLLINTAVDGSHACYVTYQGSNNTLMLATDAGNAWLGPIVAGTGATLQNSQCVLNGIGSSGVGSGNSLTLTAALSFKAAFAGSRTVFLNADAGLMSAGWQSRGTWTVPGAAAAAVTADSVSPSSGSTASATLTAVYSHTAGFANLGHEYLLINTAVNGSNACYVVYQGSNNSLMLLNDAGNAWLGPIAAGTGGTLQNSQCVLNGIGSSGVGSGSSLTLTVSLSFKAAFAGSRTVFLNADAGLLSAGWQSRGTWMVPGAAAAAVTADSVSPSSGNTASATLTAVYSHTAGFANLGHEYLLINTAMDGSHACYVTYQGSNNTLMLLNDAGNAWLGPIAAGTGATLQNSQCVLNGIGSSGVGSGNSLTLTVALSFKAAFTGSKTVFLNADGGGLNSGWQSRGTWTAP